MQAIVAVVFLCALMLGYLVSIAAGGGLVGLITGAGVALAVQYGSFQAQGRLDAVLARQCLRRDLLRTRAALDESTEHEAVARHVDGP